MGFATGSADAMRGRHLVLGLGCISGQDQPFQGMILIRTIAVLHRSAVIIEDRVKVTC